MDMTNPAHPLHPTNPLNPANPISPIYCQTYGTCPQTTVSGEMSESDQVIMVTAIIVIFLLVAWFCFAIIRETLE